jgi:hypothetical protein
MSAEDHVSARLNISEPQLGAATQVARAIFSASLFDMRSAQPQDQSENATVSIRSEA